MGNNGVAVTLVGPTHPFRGGISHHTTLLYRALARAHRVALIGFSRQYPSSLFPGRTQFDESRVTFRVPSERLLNPLNPLSWLKVFLKIRKQQAQVVVFQWWQPFFGPCLGSVGYLLQLFSNQRVVFVVHNVAPHESHWVDRLLTRYAWGSADRLVVQAEQQRAQARRLLPRADIVLCHHPVYDQFCLSGLSQEEARSRLGVAGNVLLFFGYVRPYKGLKYLIRALPEVLRELDVTLLVAGEFYEPLADYRQLVDALDLEPHVRLLDRYVPNEEVELYLSACDAVVCPYTSGTQSGIVQVAYAFERPVVCTRVGGLPEMVLDGKTGVLVAPEDPHDLARGIRRLLRTRDEQDLGRNIRGARTRFGWAPLVAAIVNG